MMDDDDDEVEATHMRDPRELIKEIEGRSSEAAYLIMLAGPTAGEMLKVDEDAVIGRSPQCAIYLPDSEASREHARLRVTPSGIVLTDLGSRNGTLVNGQAINQRVLKDGDKIQIGSSSILKFSYHDEFDAQFQKDMYSAAIRDGLTGVYNRKFLEDRLEIEFSYSRRHESPLSLIVFDIDHFKQVNDVHGHLAGDRVLALVAKRVSETIRREDVLARYGGEEFVVVCRSTPLEQALQLAERIRSVTEQHVVGFGDKELRVTVSLGVAQYPHGALAEPKELLANADSALYKAKGEGRNRAVAHR